MRKRGEVNRFQRFSQLLSAGAAIIGVTFAIGWVAGLEVALSCVILLFLASFIYFYHGDIIDIKNTLRSIDLSLKRLVDKSQKFSSEERTEEEKTTGRGAFAGMVVGGALGLPFGPIGVIVGGVIGALIGDQIERDEIKRRRKERFYPKEKV